MTQPDYEFLPMQIHKNLVIACLRDHPEDLRKINKGWQGTAQELIDALRASPHEWIIDGILADAPEGNE